MLWKEETEVKRIQDAAEVVVSSPECLFWPTVPAEMQRARDVRHRGAGICSTTRMIDVGVKGDAKALLIHQYLCNKYICI